ncbi:hypothetical protein JNUCC0626_13705 [Lentzea sp. JNUCC 0626]|uniref:hypothetical protein n=1 Tax=Lentzea sp. JNUCC 0626 TaxID=3367513 RepID=UPI0037487AC6
MNSAYVVIIVVLGFVAGVLANWFARPGWLKNGALIVIVVLTLGSLAVVTIVKDAHDGEQTAQEDERSGGRVATTTVGLPEIVATTALPTTTPAAPKPATTTPAVKVQDKPTVNAEPQVALRYLTDIGPIGGYGNFESAGVATIAGVAYTKSVTFSPGVFNKTVKDLSFTVPSGLGRFKATVGLNDNTLPDYVAQIDIMRRDGSSVARKTLRAGESQQIDESVASAGIITVRVAVTVWAADAVNNRPHIVLGDGQFVR